jgi:hypothetical protein
MTAQTKVAEPTIVMAGNLITYSMGPACLIAADRERKEILAFIGTAADAPIEGSVRSQPPKQARKRSLRTRSSSVARRTAG